MTAAIIWIIRLILLYAVIKIVLSATSRIAARKFANPAKKVVHYDTNGKKVSNGDFKDIKD
jgi:hypothetical protein